MSLTPAYLSHRAWSGGDTELAAIDRGVLMMMAQSFQVSSLQHEGVRKGGGGSVICSPFPRREALDCLLSLGGLFWPFSNIRFWGSEAFLFVFSKRFPLLLLPFGNWCRSSYRHLDGKLVFPPLVKWSVGRWHRRSRERETSAHSHRPGNREKIA